MANMVQLFRQGWDEATLKQYEKAARKLIRRGRSPLVKVRLLNDMRFLAARGWTVHTHQMTTSAANKFWLMMPPAETLAALAA